MPRLRCTFAALAAAGVLVAGCGSSNSSTGTGTGSSGAGGGGYGAGAPAKTQTQKSSSSSSATASSTTKSSSGTTTSSSTAIGITAVETNGLSFSKKALTAKAGKVTIAMANPSKDSLPHGVVIQGNGVNQSGQVVQPGGTSKVSANLKAGTYTFFCPVPGHRAAGMEGTLTVR